MRKASLFVLLLGFMASPQMQAQHMGKDSNRQQDASAKGISLAGLMSKDGKTLMAEDDNVWTVINTKVLEAFKGRHVTVKCRMDLEKHSILVLYILEPTKAYYSNYLRDSAFRR